MTQKSQPRRIDARVGHTRISKGPIRGPIPLNSFIMKIDGQERLIKKAYGVESTDSRRVLSGRHSVLVLLDLAEMQGTEDWYGYELSPAEARKLAASLTGIADEIEAMTTATPPAEDDITGPKWTDDDEARFQEAEQEAIEAQRRHAHDADIASRGYEPYGEGENEIERPFGMPRNYDDSPDY